MTAPNIILITFDDMTCEQLQRMPQLARLAQSGVNFLSAYANTALCQPARATFFTGQYSHNHGVLDNVLLAPLTLLDHSTMLPRQLQLAGYRTCHVGKYLNSWTVADAIPAGWDEWHLISPQQYFSYSINDNGVTTAKGTNPADYHTAVCSNRALAFIAAAAQPFFMQIGFKCPHYDSPSTDFLNATPSPEYAGVTGTAAGPRPASYNVPMGTPPAYMVHAAMDAPKIAEVDAFWHGSSEMLFSADNTIAAIVAAIAAAGKSNTVIIVTSDHGYFHGEGRNPACKVAPYLPSIQVPLIISGPAALVAQGKVCARLVSHVDIAATIFALSGATPARTLDGVSLAPLLADPNSAALRNYLLLEWLGTNGGITGWNVQIPICRSLLSPAYLYTLYATAEEELYDLQADPFQLANLAGTAAYAGLKANLAARIAAAQACVGAACML